MVSDAENSSDGGNRKVSEIRRVYIIFKRSALNGVGLVSVPVPPSDRSPGHCRCYESHCCSEADDDIGPS